MKNGEYEVGESVQILGEPYRIIGIAQCIDGYVLESLGGATFAAPKKWVFRFAESAAIFCEAESGNGVTISDGKIKITND